MLYEEFELFFCPNVKKRVQVLQFLSLRNESDKKNRLYIALTWRITWYKLNKEKSNTIALLFLRDNNFHLK